MVKESSLRINNVQRTDNGTYECRAEVDSYGQLMIRNIDLKVLCKFGFLQMNFKKCELRVNHDSLTIFLDRLQLVGCAASVLKAAL